MIGQLLLLTTIAGVAMPLGAWVASKEHIKSDWLETEFRHLVIAFGGGALLAAVALVLIPDGTKPLAVSDAAVCFAAGGLAFCGLQALLNRSDSSASQLVAMLSDFVPEVIALGATVAAGGHGAVLLAAIIALQNLPEGFNSYRELREGGLASRTILWGFAAAAALGPVCGAIGYAFLVDYPAWLGRMQVFAAAGILYLVFEDIAPQAKLKTSCLPALGAVSGFLLGLIGKLIE